MLNFGKRASILPPTLPKSGMNPVTNIIAYPVQVVIESFVRQSSLQVQKANTAQLIQQQKNWQQRVDAIPAQMGLQSANAPNVTPPRGVLERMAQAPKMKHPMRLRMGLATFEAAALPGADPASRTTSLPNGGGVGGVPGGDQGGFDPFEVAIPVEPDTPITETDTEEDAVTTQAAPVSPAPSVTTQIADAIIGGNGIAPTPDAGGSIVAPGPGGTQPTVPTAPSLVTGPATYTYSDIKGYVMFNVENKGMNQMPLSLLVSARIGEVELTRSNFKTRLMPMKARQFKSEFVLEGDHSALIKAIKGDLTGDTAFPETVNVTVDAVVQWHLFRNSVSQTLGVPLKTNASF
jgi:hypothetical protein